jgi:hypothetical protein
MQARGVKGTVSTIETRHNLRTYKEDIVDVSN